MSDDQLNVKVKMTSNNQTFDISVSKSGLVLDLKKACVEKTGLKESEQNLVYKGRILADDKNIADYNIGNDHTLILVKKYSQESKTEQKTENITTNTNTIGTNSNTDTTSNQNLNNNPFLGLGGDNFSGLGGLPGMGGMGADPSQLSAMLNNPMYMSMMNQMLADPNTLNMIMNSPQLKPILDGNPQIRQMMQNPQMMQMLLNPQNLQNSLNMMGQGGQTGLGGFGQPGQTGQNTNQSGQTGQTGQTGFNPFLLGSKNNY